MNTLKIFSILLFSIPCFAVCIFLAKKILKDKTDNNVMLNNGFIKLCAIFISVSLVLNLVFQKVIYLYDVIDKYFLDFDFIKLFEIGRSNYGFNSEMLKVTTIYMVLAFVWIVIISGFSKIITKKFFEPDTSNYKIFEGVIMLCLTVAFYPVLSFILDNFYLILEMPKIN